MGKYIGKFNLKDRLLSVLKCSTPAERASILGIAVSTLLSEYGGETADGKLIESTPAATCCDELHSD